MTLPSLFARTVGRKHFSNFCSICRMTWTETTTETQKVIQKYPKCVRKQFLVTAAAIVEVISPIVHIHDGIVIDQVLLVKMARVDTPFVVHKAARRLANHRTHLHEYKAGY